jgi:hypothetical protein
MYSGTINRDDITITPRFKADRQTPKQRAEEERRTVSIRKRNKRVSMSLRKMRNMRRAVAQKRGRKTRRSNPKARSRKSPGIWRNSAVVKAGAKAGSRLVPLAGQAALLLDLLVVGGQLTRRFSGDSMRKIHADDAKVMSGTLTEEIIANQVAVQFAENDSSVLRTVGATGRMSSCLQEQIKIVKEDAYHRATATGWIQRSKEFDSPEMILDRIIAAFREGDIPGQVDEFIEKVRGTRSSPGR